MIEIGEEWDSLLRSQFESDYYQKLRAFLKEEYGSKRIYPSMYDIFNAYRYTPYSSVKAVILGQDPYHGAGQAHGLCFSVKQGIEPPPSLINIFKEIKSDLGYEPPNHGCLTKWAENGVMLLNTVLTVEAGKANSHQGKGWEQFTDYTIKLLSEREKPMVFLLWGRNARNKKPLIDTRKHLVLEAAHPSPLSAYNGFFGCRHFSKANEFLAKHSQTIDWKLENIE